MGNNCCRGQDVERYHDIVQRDVPRWDAEFPRMTMEQLQIKRKEFWETRTGGRREMWQAIHLSMETNDIATSAAILEGAGLTPLDLDKKSTCCYCFDERGNRYDIPMYISSVPYNLINDDELVKEKSRPTTQPGRAKDDVKIPFRLRFSSGVPDREMKATSSLTIEELKSDLGALTSTKEFRRIRVIVSGRILPDHSEIGSVIKQGSIVQIAIPKQ